MISDFNPLIILYYDKLDQSVCIPTLHVSQCLVVVVAYSGRDWLHYDLVGITSNTST